MKTNFYPWSKYICIVSMLVFLASCSTNDDNSPNPGNEPTPEVPLRNLETEYARLIIAKHAVDSIKILSFKNERQTGYKVHSSVFSLYSFHDDRYAGIVHRAAGSTEGKTEFFDSGIETHDDHAHDDDPETMLDLKVNGNLPTHFKYKTNFVNIFNDGDGSVSVVEVTKMRNSGYAPKVINTGLAHHGASIALANGKQCATIKSAGVSGSLPQRVNIYDENGIVVHTSDSVIGIHGQAGNGTDALFGSNNGVLWVKDNNTSELLPNPSELNTASGFWLGTIWEDPLNKNAFYGRASNVGIFKIDLSSKSISKIISLDNRTSPVSSVQMDKKGNNIFVLLNTGEVQKYSTSGSLMSTIQATAPRSGVSGDAINSMAIGKKTLFVTRPFDNKILAYDINSDKLVKTIELGYKPGSMVFLGWFE